MRFLTFVFFIFISFHSHALDSIESSLSSLVSLLTCNFEETAPLQERHIELTVSPSGTDIPEVITISPTKRTELALGRVYGLSGLPNLMPLISKTREATDFKAMKHYYEWLRVISDDIFVFAVQNHSAVCDYRAHPPLTTYNQIWFDGRIILNATIDKTMLRVGFDTPLGHKAIFSTHTKDLGGFLEKFEKKYNTSQISTTEGNYKFELHSFDYKNTEYKFACLAMGGKRHNYKPYVNLNPIPAHKTPSQFVISASASDIYQYLEITPPTSIYVLLNLKPHLEVKPKALSTSEEEDKPSDENTRI